MTLGDSSAFVALINSSDTNHKRCAEALPRLPSQLITTLPCLTESMHLLGRYGGWPAQRAVWSYVEARILLLHLNDIAEQTRMRVLMEQYKDLPMDLADASLVAAAEVLHQSQIFTFDRDFYVYRLNGNQSFEVVP